MSAEAFDHLVVVHSHWRPGGVRRVVELALPEIVRAGTWRKVTLLSGGDDHLELPPLGVETVDCLDPAFDYFPAGGAALDELRVRIRRTLERVTEGGDARRVLLWFHNPALAKNPLVCAGVAEFAAATGAAVVMHHHDFWCAGRWERWRTLQACGLKTPAEAASVLFADGVRCRHVAINLADCRTIGPYFPGSVDYLPNPVVRTPALGGAWVGDWINERTGGRPLWVCPTRMLRRKNLLEAVLLARWLRPEAVLATTSGAFSPDEERYANAVREVAESSGGRVVTGFLEVPGAPSVAQLLPQAEAVVLTSVREGFGMGFVEAAAAGTPVIARRLPHVDPDLEALGFVFPHRYDEIWIAPNLIDEAAERERQRELLENARAGWRVFGSGGDFEWSDGKQGATAFSRLTLEGQLEVLRCPSSESWKVSRKWNPELLAVEEGVRLQPTAWPTGGRGSVEEYARSFLEIAKSIPGEPVAGDAAGAQDALSRAALDPQDVYPLLV